MKMPISARLMANGGLMQPSRVMNTRTLAAEIKSAVHFETQVASDLYWLGKQNDYSLDSSFGPIRLPYPSIWMEWRIPNRVVIYGKPADTTPAFVGCLLLEDRKPDGNLRIQTVSVFADINGTNLPAAAQMSTMFDVDEEGRFVPNSLRRMYDKTINEHDAQNMSIGVAGHETVAFLALNLINCKNITTRKAGTVQVRRSGSAKRRNEPKIDYHTIVLPGTDIDRERVKGKRRELSQDLMPVHRVRGHFKTFTADAPLLGQHVGTYWWGWQVRGSSKNGMVVTDYEVAK